GCEFGQAVVVSFGPAILDREIAAIDPTEFTHSLHEGSGPLTLCCRRTRTKQADGRELTGLLRACWGRPRDGCASQKCDEVAPSHAKLLVEDKALPKGSVVRHSKIGRQVQRWVRSGTLIGTQFVSYVRFAPNSGHDFTPFH